jgi:LacI family transcriptional regulator
MSDVARLAGVSQTTVSFIINNNTGVSIPEETRERVLTAVTELGYRPNAFAKGLRSQRSNLIGFLTDQIAVTPYAVRAFEGAQDSAWANGKILLLINTKSNQEMEKAAVNMFLEQQVEGIVYATMYHRSILPPEPLREIPTVLLDCFTEDRSFPSVVPDETGGGKKAVQVLLEKGHRRIGFLNNCDPIPASCGRLEGYQQALAEYGLPYDSALVCCDSSDPGGGYRCTQQLMRLAERPTALFCFNDRMAMGVYDALRKLNLRIPEEVAVIGFDNQEIIAEHLYPPLSTIALPHYQMGQWAVNHLIQLSQDEGDEPVQKILDCPYIGRSSA